MPRNKNLRDDLSRPYSEQGRANYDKVFGVKQSYTRKIALGIPTSGTKQAKKGK